MEGFDPTEIIACALRPQGSWPHALGMLAFVLAAWLVAPGRRAARARIDSER